MESCEHLLVRFGGHSQAAGLTILTKDIPQLKTCLEAYSDRSLDTQGLVRNVEIDAVITLEDLDEKMIRWINYLEPYGPGNTRPTFASIGVKVLEHFKMGREQQHLRMTVEAKGTRHTALAFNQANKWKSNTQFVDLAYTVMNDSFRGKSAIALRLVDFKESKG